MTARRKRVTMTVTVSCPPDMSAAEARREVRSLITHQANWSADCYDMRAIKVSPVRA